MRKLVVAVLSALAVAGIVAPSAGATSTSSNRSRSSQLSLTAKITRFRATRHGIVADGIFTGKLQTGRKTSRDRAPVRFQVVAKPRHGRCDIITLHLAQLYLQLLGVQVTTSTINLDVSAHRGRVLGDLFCALSHAKVTFPRAASDVRTLNSRLHGHSLQVFSASETTPARTAQSKAKTCQVLKLILGPLHLDLLGLVVDLYGKTHHSPVVVTIDANPNKGLLGQLLCGLAGGSGGTGITTLSGLQNLLSTLGVNLDLTQIQNLLKNLGIDLSGGLTQLDLNKILQLLGLGSTVPTG